MGAINNAFNKAAAGLGGMAYAADSIKQTQLQLTKEDANLAEEAKDINDERNAITSDDNYKLLQLIANKGHSESDKAMAAKELEKYQEALNVLELKQKANTIQRAYWKKRYNKFFPGKGGIK